MTGILNLRIIWIVFALIVASCIAVIAWLFIRNVKKGNSKANIYNAITLICIPVVVASWLLNFGWYRVLLTIIPLPILHIVAFVVINFAVSHKILLSDKLRRYVICSYITFLLTYFALPDGGDVGPAYVFFGLIRHDAVLTPGLWISLVCLAASVIFLVFEIVESILVGKREKNIDWVQNL